MPTDFTRIFIYAPMSLPQPKAWTAKNRIECLGAGGAGSARSSTQAGAQGGAGGGYAAVVDAAVEFPVEITSTAAVSATSGQWRFGDYCRAPNGRPAVANGAAGAVADQQALLIGAVGFIGGAGVQSATTGRGAGGGGAAGPNGPGADGGVLLSPGSGGTANGGATSPDITQPQMFGMAGAHGAEWDRLHGCGTGGNGGANLTGAALTGGSGGRFGGGGGGDVAGVTTAIPAGGPSLIVLTYNEKALRRRGAMTMIMS
jgi:hypothetical protein